MPRVMNISCCYELFFIKLGFNSRLIVAAINETIGFADIFETFFKRKNVLTFCGHSQHSFLHSSRHLRLITVLYLDLPI